MGPSIRRQKTRPRVSLVRSKGGDGGGEKKKIRVGGEGKRLKNRRGRRKTALASTSCSRGGGGRYPVYCKPLVRRLAAKCRAWKTRKECLRKKNREGSSLIGGGGESHLLKNNQNCSLMDKGRLTRGQKKRKRKNRTTYKNTKTANTPFPPPPPSFLKQERRGKTESGGTWGRIRKNSCSKKGGKILKKEKITHWVEPKRDQKKEGVLRENLLGDLEPGGASEPTS